MDKGVVIIIGITVVILGSIIGITMNNPQQKLTNSFTGEDNDTISEQGVHYHPELSIVINGQKQEIPANIGVGAQYASNKFYDPMMKMTDIHTHDPGGVLHWEVMDGPVKKGHVKLGSFFNVWGKTFTKDQIFEAKNADSGEVNMTVNGEPNSDFENYIVKDKDKIEITFN